MTSLDLIGHVGEAILLLGTYLVARKHSAGFLFRIAGSAIWVGIGWQLQLSSVWFWTAVFVVVDSYGWWSWRKRLR